jgi:predicted CXXCH cytochrome family protein
VVDEEVEVLDVEQIERRAEGDSHRRSRLALALILLLLLLLCVVTTVADVYTTAPQSSRVQAVLRNLECLQCHVELIPDFSKTAVHNPFENKSCTVCHTPHGEVVRTAVTQGPVERWERFRTLIEWLPLRIACQVTPGTGPVGRVGGTTTATETVSPRGTSTLRQPLPELCWTCHGNVAPEMGLAFQHNPFFKGQCLTCHDPHASDFKRLMVVSERDLCMTCHPIAAEIAKRQKHPPFADRSCTVCHRPHASEWKRLLVARQRVLCFSCHPRVAQMASLPVQHGPFLNDNCTGCHQPHASDYLRLLVLDQPPLCYTCHPRIGDDFLRVSHHPVGAVRLTCADCHDPHAAQYKALLDATDNAFCYGCHGSTYQVSIETSLHRRTLCIRCHTPHGSDWKPLLRDSNPDLCLGCHSPMYYDESSRTVFRNNHPVRPWHLDVAAGKPLTCTSTCHNPHGTANNFMLRNWIFPYDGGCLQCHGVVPGKRVGVDF